MTTPPDDPFFRQVEQTSHDTPAGPCDLPIMYWGASMLGLTYRVDAAAAQSFMPNELIEPQLIFGKAIALLCLFEYRDTSIGPYNEIGLAIQTKRKGTRPSLLAMAQDLASAPDQALYIVNLPVTTEAARAAGAGLWGYPKSVAGIDTDFGVGFKATLQGELTVEMGKPGSFTSGGLPFLTYSFHDTGMLHTHVPVDHRVKWGGAGTVKVEVIGDGPTAKSVRALGLDQMKPLAAFRTDRMRSILPAGEIIQAAESAAPQRAVGE